MRKSIVCGVNAAAILCALLAVAGCGGSGNSPQISVSPSSAQVTPGGQQKFFAHVDNAIDNVALFQLQGGGSIDVTQGNEFTFTAPTTATPGTTSTVLVSARDGSAEPRNVIISIQLGTEVLPAAADVSVRRTFVLEARVNGDAANAANWLVEAGGAGGTITQILDGQGNAIPRLPNGNLPPGPKAVYSAPATADDREVDIVRATSALDNTKSDTASISVRSGDLPVNVQ